jgi:hypothetical protein
VTRLLVAPETAVVGFGANRRDEIGLIKSVEHPTGPAFGRSAGHILIERGIETVLTEPLGQGEHPVCMLRGVMAIAKLMKKTFGLGPSDWVVLEGPWHSSGLGKGLTFRVLSKSILRSKPIVKIHHPWLNSHKKVVLRKK